MTLRVVIVEDEQMLRNGLAHSPCWEKMDCAVVGTAANGLAGLQMIDDLRPHVVLTDIRMPVMDGLMMLGKACKLYSFCSLILTSYADFDYAKSAINVGVTEYLLKPLDEADLECALSNIRTHWQSISDGGQQSKAAAQGANAAPRCDLFENMVWQEMNPYVFRACRYIREHRRNKISIADAAEKLQISTSYLSRQIRQAFDMPFVELANRYKIREALHIIEQDALKIYEVSDFLGFTEYKYFCSVFKKYTGIAPTEYMKLIHLGDEARIASLKNRLAIDAAAGAYSKD